MIIPPLFNIIANAVITADVRVQLIRWLSINIAIIINLKIITHHHHHHHHHLTIIIIITISPSSTSHHHHHKQHHQNHPLFSSSSPPKAQLGVITRSAAVQLIGYWSALISAADKAQQGTGYDRDDQIIPPLLLLSIFFRFLKKSKTLCLPLFCIFSLLYTYLV